MSADFISKIIRGGSTFNFSDPYDLEKWGEEEFVRNPQAAETPGSDGEWQGGSTASARLLTLPGILIGSDYSDLRTKFDTLLAALDGEMNGPELTVYKHSDRYIKGRLAYLRRDEDNGLDYLLWTLGLRCADPFWYDNTADSFTFGATTVATAITPGGTYPTLPTITFVVSNPGTITVVYAATGEGFAITPLANGSYVIDCAAGTVIKDGTTDVISIFTGSFLESGLLPSASTITMTLSGGATVSSKTASWRKRYHFG
jgi:phage-related protein